MNEQGQVKPIRFRQPIAQVALSGVVCLPILFDLLSPRPDGYHRSTTEIVVLVVVLLTVLSAAAFSRTFGVILDPEVARVNGLRRQVVPWRRVQAVSTESMLGTRRVVLWTDDGGRIPLRAPTATIFGGRFDVKFHQIGQWWLAHRGADWKPVPPAQRYQR
jgi:hypothetical protein